jgi:hypothetical protein
MLTVVSTQKAIIAEFFIKNHTREFDIITSFINIIFNKAKNWQFID